MYSTAVDLLNQQGEQEKEAELLLSCAVTTLQDLVEPRSPRAEMTKKRRRLMMEPLAEGRPPEVLDLLAESQVLLGRLVEWMDPQRASTSYKSALRVSPENSEANLQLGRFEMTLACTTSELEEAGCKLKNAVRFAQAKGEKGTCEEAKKLLARLLYQANGRDREADRCLQSLGFSHVLCANHLAQLTPVSPTDEGQTEKNARLNPDFGMSASAPVHVFDNILCPSMLLLMQSALAPDAAFWGEHAYNSPRTGFFSYQHSLPPFEQAALAQSSRRVQESNPRPGENGVHSHADLDTVLQHVWRGAASGEGEGQVELQLRF
jgi:hypothetical protein